MSNPQDHRRRDFSNGLFIAMIFLITIETMFFIRVILNIEASLREQQFELLLPNDPVAFLLYAIVPVVYCSFASLLFHPKRLVNPLLAQVAVTSIVSLMAMLNLSKLSNLPYNTQVLVTIFSVNIAFSSGVAFSIGIMQWIVVRWVIRVNYEDSDRISFEVNMKTKEILHKLGSSFLDTWSFSRQRDVGEMWFLERNDNDRCLAIEVGTHPKDESKSILATVAYEIQHDWIVRSSAASDLRDIIVKNIQDRLGIRFNENRVNLDDPVSRLANSNVKDKAQSRLEEMWSLLRHVPRLYQIAIVLTLVLLTGFSIAFFSFNERVNISSDTYIGVAIALLFSLFIEIGFPLREELSKKKRDELEFDQ